MRIIIIRHGDPDYENNTLTPRGFEEVKALGKKYSAKDFDEIYCSPLERAKLTAEAVIKGEKEIKICDWLKEFEYPIYLDNSSEKMFCWDFKPSFFAKNSDFNDNSTYLDNKYLKTGNVKEYYQNVVEQFDEILKKKGYQRKDGYYKVLDANRETIVFFCHFVLMSVLLSHLFNLPYVALSQYMCCPPSGVTILVSEEREKGIAQFRMLRYGDISHLNDANLEPSFSGRFCEIYDSEERH